MTINIEQLTEQYPLVKELIELKEVSWFNPSITRLEEGLSYVGLGSEDIQDASQRLKRFAPYLAKAFPETAKQTELLSLRSFPFQRCKACLSVNMTPQYKVDYSSKKTVTYPFLAL